MIERVSCRDIEVAIPDMEETNWFDPKFYPQSLNVDVLTSDADMGGLLQPVMVASCSCTPSCGCVKELSIGMKE